MRLTLHSAFWLILALIMLAIIAVVPFDLLHNEDRYDFPLVRTVEKELEDITDSTGATISTEKFVEVTEPQVQVAASSSERVAREESPGENEADKNEPKPLPARIRIQVPFLVQAPTGNWDMPYQEACEEASLIMVHHFLEGTTVTPTEADAEILAIVAWENDKFNYSADVTLEELKKISEDYYRHTGQLFYDFTIEDMKKLLAAGHPIILPVAGRDIGNPYFSGLGPWYHMLVVTGYDGDEFITNDPGTKRGEGYRYPQRRLFDAIHNWTGAKEGIRSGNKVMLVLER